MSNLITPNGDGVTSLTDRQIKREMTHNATIGDVNEIAYLQAVKATNHLGNQIPAQIETQCRTLIAEAFAAFAEITAAREADLLARIERLERIVEAFPDYALIPRQPSAPVDATGSGPCTTTGDANPARVSDG